MTELPRNISYQDVENAHVNHILEATGLFVCTCRTHTLTEILESITEDVEKLKRAQRLLIAYARNGTYPSRHTLKDLAEVTGMSVSGVRTAYNETELADLQNILYPSTPDHYAGITEDEVPW